MAVGRAVAHQFGRRARRIAPGCRDDLDIPADLEAQPGFVQSLGDDRGVADQHRTRQLLVDRDLRRAQHPLVLAFGKDDAAAASLAARPRRPAA